MQLLILLSTGSSTWHLPKVPTCLTKHYLKPVCCLERGLLTIGHHTKAKQSIQSGDVHPCVTLAGTLALRELYLGPNRPISVWFSLPAFPYKGFPFKSLISAQPKTAKYLHQVTHSTLVRSYMQKAWERRFKAVLPLVWFMARAKSGEARTKDLVLWLYVSFSIHATTTLVSQGRFCFNLLIKGKHDLSFFTGNEKQQVSKPDFHHLHSSKASEPSGTDCTLITREKQLQNN